MKPTTPSLETIYQQPEVLATCLDQWLQWKHSLPQFIPSRCQKIQIIASGASWHTALLGKYLLEQLVHISTEVSLASEYIDAPPPIVPNTLMIFVSLGKELLDIFQKVAIAQEEQGLLNSLQLLALNCSQNITIEEVITTPPGFLGESMFFYSLALNLGENSELEMRKQLWDLPELIAAHLNSQAEQVHCLLRHWKARPCVIFGRGINYPIALEGARLLQKTGCLHAQGYAAGEFHHGPKAIIQEGFPIFVIAPPQSAVYPHILRNAQAMKDLGAELFGITPKDTTGLFSQTISIPDISAWLSPLISLIPLQFLAHYLSSSKKESAGSTMGQSLRGGKDCSE